MKEDEKDKTYWEFSNEGWEGVTHHLKLSGEYISPVIEGDKTFEIRLNDRSYMQGDFVRFLEEIDGEWHETEGWPLYEIAYILEDFVGLAEGYVAFSISEVKNA